MTIYLIILFGVIWYVINGFWNLLKSFLFLKKGSNKFYNDKLKVEALNNLKKKIIILMPVLREQEIIVKNLELFTKLKGDYELVYITTQKEDDEKLKKINKLILLKKQILNSQNVTSFVENLVGLIPYSIAENLYQKKKEFKDDEKYWEYIVEAYKDLPSTLKIIDSYLKKNRNYCQNVHRIHYPYKNGVMAHQLNYACEKLLKTHNPEETYILVYNADSSVEKNILNIFAQKINDGEIVIIQSSLFLDNYNSFPSSFRGGILKNIALAQSRWTLVHEINRIRAQYEQGVKSIYESAHVVGHGTCIRMDKLMSVGGFPEKFINEDLPLGYFLALSGERICLVVELENAQSPTTIKSVITQYTTWFYGAMDYFLYYKYASNKLKLPKFKALFWAIVNSIRAVMWLLSPWVWIGLLVFPLYRGIPVVAFAVFCLFLFHTAFSHWLIASFVKKNPQVLGKEIFHIEYNIKTAFAVPVSYIIWGIGPLRSFIQVMTARILGREIYKRKTER